jgi:SAM-dependent methyltransferase
VAHVEFAVFILIGVEKGAMALLGGVVADGLLRFFDAEASEPRVAEPGDARSRLEMLFGAGVLERIAGRRVLDFGCGNGSDAVAIALGGARMVVGLDILEAGLQRGRAAAARHGVAGRCSFVTQWDQPMDVILSIDAFEHFADPAAILRTMSGLLAPGGKVLLSFGPTWFHPLGGHLFSVFPWSHLLFTEAALMRWRARYRNDGARRFAECEGGLNQMTIARFERLVDESPLRLDALETVPIRRLRKLHGHWSREFTTSLVRAGLSAREPAAAAA